MTLIIRGGLKQKYTLEEFKELSGKSDRDYELIDGEIIPIRLGSASINHGILTTTIAGILNRELKDTKCVAIAESTEVSVKKDNDITNIFRPDIVVICDDVDLNSKVTDSPKLIVEVLSPSTALNDRTKKLYNYSNIDGLKGYLIVEKNESRVELHRVRDGHFYYEVFVEGDIVKIDDWVKISVDEIYENLLKMSTGDRR